MRVKYHDFPLRDVAAKAATLHAQTGANFYQKWTCSWCGSRQGMETPNIFYTSGICEECNRVSEIENCNYMVTFGRDPLAEKQKEKT